MLLLNNLNSCSDLIFNDNLNDILIANLISINFTLMLMFLNQNNVKKKKSGVYRWVNNINGKIYIGSAIDLCNRIIRYYNYKEISDRRKNILIHKALLKYGYLNFTLEILEYC